MIIRYEQLTNLSKDYKTFIHEYEGNYIPDKGSTVNIKGEPYIVYKTGMAIDNDNTEYVYLTVIRINPVTKYEENSHEVSSL
jgi:predicted small secreted protein